MNLRRVGVLFVKDLKGPKNFIFVMALVVPFALTLIVSLLFGTLFSQRARLGIVDLGESRLPALASHVESIATREFAGPDSLHDAVARGAVDLGVVLPTGFDQTLTAGEATELTVFVWGESQLKHRAILGTSLLTLFRAIAGREAPVDVVTTIVGEAQTLPWEDRLLPLIVMMSMLVGGVMVPATAIVEEREKKTLRAVTTSPATMGEILAAKGLTGVLLSSVMGFLTLMMNRALGTESALLVAALGLGAMLAVTLGLLLGLLVKDVNTLFAAIKSMGIILYAPALISMFPEIPSWIGRLFPTYYAIQPVMDIAQNGAGLADVAPNLFVLTGLILLLTVVVGWAARRAGQQAAA